MLQSLLERLDETAEHLRNGLPDRRSHRWSESFAKGHRIPLYRLVYTRRDQRRESLARLWSREALMRVASARILLM